MTNLTSYRIGLVLMMILYLGLTGECLAKNKPEAFDSNRHFALENVQKGMKGYGLSIFSGTKIERFDVVVLDVIYNFDPKRNAILVELHGQKLEDTGVIAGMSGSPVFFKDPSDGKDKIAGAVAFGWSFARQGFAICGVQPIEQMLQVTPSKSKSETENRIDQTFLPRALRLLTTNSHTGESKPLCEFDRFVMAGVSKDFDADRSSAADEGKNSQVGLYPLATPIGISGISNETFNKLSSVLSPLNLVPVKTGSTSASAGMAEIDNHLVPAGVLAVPLAMGDINIAGVGTVTDVQGDRVWGFGHAMFSEGPIELPMAAGRIHSIIPTIISSFKLGSSYKPIGSLYSDENTAVAGKIGNPPPLYPMNVMVNFNGVKTECHYDIAMHYRLSPLFAGICAGESIRIRRELPEFHTVKYSGWIDFDNYGKVFFNNVTSNNDVAPVLTDIAEPVNLMLNNDFARIKFKGINLNVEVTTKNSAAMISQGQLDKTKYRPGETAKIELLLTRMRLPDVMESISFTVPDDLPDGAYPITVGGFFNGISSDRRTNPNLYKANNTKDLYQMIQRIMDFRGDRYYLVLASRESGFSYRRHGMPQLPASKLVQLKEQDPALTMQFSRDRLIPINSKYVISGMVALNLVISRD